MRMRGCSAFDVAAFTRHGAGGNMAGVVVIDDGAAWPAVEEMQEAAVRAGYSEVVFAQRVGASTVRARYFTPKKEVDMCGHATIALFGVLRDECGWAEGQYTLHTNDGDYTVRVERELVFIEFPRVTLISRVEPSTMQALYAALGSAVPADSAGLPPVAIVKAGLADVQMPVASREQLMGLVLNAEQAARLSEQLEVIALHAYAIGDGPERTIYCRDFAPVVCVNEESATGTANAGLGWWLHQCGRVALNERMRIWQGDALGQEAEIMVENLQHTAGDAVRTIVGGRVSIHANRPPAWWMA